MNAPLERIFKLKIITNDFNEYKLFNHLLYYNNIAFVLTKY